MTGSSESVGMSAGNSFIQVKLVVENSATKEHTSENIEMSLESFYTFLHQLSKAKATLEQRSFI